jgi:branched-chain amino acid transport system permease protein
MRPEMETKSPELSEPAAVGSHGLKNRLRAPGYLIVIGYLALTLVVARSSLSVQSVVLIAAVFGVLAISLDLVAGMLGLYSLGQGGFFAIGAYLTAIAASDYDANVFLLLPIVVVATGLLGMAIGALSLRVSGLYFSITTFIFTLVLTVLATDSTITRGTQGLLGPVFPDFPDALAPLGAPVAWCAMSALLIAAALMWNIRRSPLYPVLLSIRDAEPFAEAAGVRTSLVKIGVFGLSAALAGSAGWVFSFLGVVSPGQFDWSVSLNILVMVLVGGIDTTLGPIVGAAFVTMFPAIVNINPWIQEMLYGALSIVAITVFPEGVVGLAKRRLAWRYGEGIAAPSPEEPSAIALGGVAAPTTRASPETVGRAEGGETIVECRGIQFNYGLGPQVLRDVDLRVQRGHIHGLIGPNGSGKSTLANIIAGRLHPQSGTINVKGRKVDGLAPSERARRGLRRTFQAAELVRSLSTAQNVLVGLYSETPGIARRAAIWTLLRSGRRDLASMMSRAEEALGSVGAARWTSKRVGDVPHGVEQLTQLASVCVAGPDIIVLDEPATGLSSGEVEHLARILTDLKTRGVTMIIIEHQTRFLFPLCDRVTVLNAGEVVLTGSSDEVRVNPIVRQVYLGE